jgi:hypothetical protein
VVVQDDEIIVTSEMGFRAAYRSAPTILSLRSGAARDDDQKRYLTMAGS